MKLILIGTICCFLLSSCIKNNPDPSWIEISAWTLESNPDLNGIEGELSHNISDVYLTIDDEIMGMFELPIKLPILKEGSHKIILYPVVKNNGISATKKIYPFCETYTIQANLVKNQTLKINPTTRYAAASDFWIEDFEGIVKINTEPSSSATLVQDNNPSILKYGNYYGHVQLNTTDSLWYGITSSENYLPKNNAEVYLEIDYFTTNSVLTGLKAYNSSGFTDNPNIQLNPQDGSSVVWKKIYIDLHELVSGSVNATKFEHYFQALLDDGKSSTDVYLDNLKVIHF